MLEVESMSEAKATQTKGTEQETTTQITELDPKFKYEISKIPGAEKIMLCFQCGTCTADCPVSRFSDSYRPRKFVRMAQIGLKSKVISNDAIWLCAACFTCVDHCPQGVDISGIIRALKNMAVKEGHMPAVFKEQSSNILKTGYAFVVSDLRLRKRGEAGLPPLPKGSPDCISKIFEITGFSKLFQKEKL